ncbi:hypothetical protein NE237_010593 [Protea cynaroides]|uniref:GDSL esterase/lipase n=1 Tax=Protea cynaroides TaxID=273540 RepID=A0A9Q0R1E5_9MAGN|nr:hypothetical protein NE237_010593 [Protea cynaroides]
MNPTTCNASALPKFTALLVFGDSTVDTGNNNFLQTVVKSSHFPYGREFPGHIPTGRFSDGRLVPDLLASALGIKEFIPPFLDPHLSDKEILTGVSFASAGSGFDDLTTSASGVITTSQQLQYFKEYIDRLTRIVGEQEANKIVSGSLVLIGAGTNDLLRNYYDLPIRKVQFNISAYQDFLLQKVQDFVKELMDLGSRNFLIAGVPPLGCVPIQITLKFTHARGCVEDENGDAQLYNSKLIGILKQIQESGPGSKVVYANIYDSMMDMFINPQKYGFTETNKGCCGTGFIEAGPLCNLLSPSCANASEYLFWDCVHPGEVAYRYMTNHIVDNALPYFLL